MTYNVLVTFHTIKSPYNPKVGKPVDEEINSQEIMANVTDMGTEQTQQLFGNVKHQMIVIRLREMPVGSWSYLTLEDSGKHFVRVTSRQPQKANTLIVSESNEFESD